MNANIENILNDILSELRQFREKDQAQSKEESKFIGVDDVCKLLGKSKATIRRYIERGELVPSHRVRRTLYFKTDEIFLKPTLK